MPFAAVNGIDLYYEIQGSGPTVVFAHGAGGNHASWYQQVPFFERYYEVVIHEGCRVHRTTWEGPGRVTIVRDVPYLGV
jgi:3-oxoadipate enol-lactonase